MNGENLGQMDLMVSGRWYIVEGMMVIFGTDASSAETDRHNRGMLEMRRCGPYFSRKDANQALYTLRDWQNPYLFHCRPALGELTEDGVNA